MQHVDEGERAIARPPTVGASEVLGGGGIVADHPRPEIFSRRRRSAAGADLPCLNEAVRLAIARFSPRDVPPVVWAEIQPLAQEWVARSLPTTADKVSAAMGIVAQLLLWVRGCGEPFEAEAVLHPETIDRFLVEGCTHLAQGTRQTYRSHLRHIGRAVLGGDLFPPATLKMPAPKPAFPYREDEIAAQLSWTRGLPTEAMRRNAGVLLALGLGAGLDATEMANLRGSEMTRDALGVLVQVTGDDPRSVPVLRTWEDKVGAFAQEAGDRYVFRPERTQVLRHQTSNFIARCAKVNGEPPAFSLQRLRTTWIVGQLAAGTPPNALARLAGTQSVQLAKYFDFLPERDGTTVRELVRNAGRS